MVPNTKEPLKNCFLKRIETSCSSWKAWYAPEETKWMIWSRETTQMFSVEGPQIENSGFFLSSNMANSTQALISRFMGWWLYLVDSEWRPLPVNSLFVASNITNCEFGTMLHCKYVVNMCGTLALHLHWGFSVFSDGVQPFYCPVILLTACC